MAAVDTTVDQKIWICASCHASVFTFKNNCYKCQKPRPSGTGGGGGGGGV